MEITVLDQEKAEGNLVKILPRKNSLIRPAVANVDQAFVIFAMDDPKPNFMLLDRFLIMMEQAKCSGGSAFFNKRSGREKKSRSCASTYAGCGYQVLFYPVLLRKEGRA